jgi:CRISPR-associated protein Csb3
VSQTNASITIPVDLTNPGQFFACCGLLELADRLWPGAEGWFEGNQFKIASNGSFNELVQQIKHCDIRSSLTAAELKRLGTLLSRAKASLSQDDQAEKTRLQQQWKVESLSIGQPFNLSLDWWRDERGNRLDPKTWAAKQLLMDIVGDLRDGADRIKVALEADLWQWVYEVDRRFNFDSDLGAMGSARDVGFSFDALVGNQRTRINVPCRPFVEFLALCGLQRCRAVATPRRSALIYCCWHVPLPPTLIGVACGGLIPVPISAFQFQLTDRNDYFKCFSPAIPFQGDDDE